METGQQTTAEVATGLRVVDIEGRKSSLNMAYNWTTGLFWNYSGRDDGANGTQLGFQRWYNYTRIHNMTITVAPRAGSMDVDLSQTVVEISNSTRKCILSYDSSKYQSQVDTDGVFGTDSFSGLGPDDYSIIELEDADNSVQTNTPVLNRGDKVMLTVNVSACFFGFEERCDIWGMIIPEEGAPGIFAFRTPAAFSDTVYDLY